MKASKEHKPQQSRVILKNKFVKHRKYFSVTQKQAYSSRAYYKLFKVDIQNWIDGNGGEFFLPTRQKEPHIHAYDKGVVLTCIGHNHRALTNGDGNINISSVGDAKDVIRGYEVDKKINKDVMYKLIGGLNILINLSKQ